MVRNAEPGWPAEKGRSETAVWLRAAQKGLCEKQAGGHYLAWKVGLPSVKQLSQRSLSRQPHCRVTEWQKKDSFGAGNVFLRAEMDSPHFVYSVLGVSCLFFLASKDTVLTKLCSFSQKKSERLDPRGNLLQTRKQIVLEGFL